MRPDLDRKVVNTIEAICAQGCRKVSQILSRVKKGDKVEELLTFSSQEIKQIINELEKIMSIYDNGSCSANK